MYTSFSAATEASTPEQLKPGRYEVTGKVVTSSVSQDGDPLRFAVRDRDGTASGPSRLHAASFRTRSATAAR